MKVIVVNSHYSKGGASRAALRLCQALECVGIKVSYISVFREKNNFLSKFCFLFRAIVDRFPGGLVSKKDVLFSYGRPSNPKLIRLINSSDADVVHLHWMNSGALSIEDIVKINKPIIWSLHDMWPFTGGCHYDEGCGRYSKGCGQCPMLSSSKAKDDSSRILERKLNTLSKVPGLKVVGLSKWIADCASQSLVFSEKQIINLPNPIDTDFFYPQIKIDARKRLNLPIDKKLILFGAMSAVDDPRKGYRQLVAALNAMPKNSNVELVVFGSKDSNISDVHGFKEHFLGYINDDDELRALYSAADVMIVPSLQENLSNAIMESMACATPVVAFDIGGNGDMIDHKKNGYLVSLCDSYGLLQGITWILASPMYEELRINARDKVVRAFDKQVVGMRYKKLYSDSSLRANN